MGSRRVTAQTATAMPNRVLLPALGPGAFSSVIAVDVPASRTDLPSTH